MVIPTSYSSAIVLLLLCCGCFSLWLNLYKAAGSRWRYELFSLDFALGAILLSLVAAYTLGLLGKEISFTDRMLIAGNAASAWVVGAGFVFTFANMLLLATITLLGVSLAVPISFATALIVIAGVQLTLRQANLPLTIGGTVVAVTAVLVSCAAAKRKFGGTLTPAGPTTRPGIAPPRRVPYKKAIVIGVLSGLAFGSLESILKVTSDAEFGPGPYASVLLMSIGLVIATPLFDLFLINIKIVGDPISLRSYRAGAPRQHLLGIGSGALWAAGALACLLAFTVSVETSAGRAPILILPVAAGVICALLGIVRWREFKPEQRGVRLSAMAAVTGLAVGLVLIGLGVN